MSSDCPIPTIEDLAPALAPVIAKMEAINSDLMQVRFGRGFICVAVGKAATEVEKLVCHYSDTREVKGDFASTDPDYVDPDDEIDENGMDDAARTASELGDDDPEEWRVGDDDQ